MLASLSPETLALLQHQLERNAGRFPVWDFPEVIAGDHLLLVRFRFAHLDTLVAAFAGDVNPYVNAEFKEPRALYGYLLQAHIDQPYRHEGGGADYLVVPCDKLLLRPGRPYTLYDRVKVESTAGIVHLYGLSLSAEDRHRGWIGYQIAPPYRGTDLGHRAVSALEAYAAHERSLTELKAMVKTPNDKSATFLVRRGYEEVTEESGEEIRVYKRVVAQH